MSKRKTAEPQPQKALIALALLGAAAAGWAVFLWLQLTVSRSGGVPFCGFGEEADCGALWDGAFAGAVHRRTGVPVAGWGLVWGLAALLLPILALRRRRPELLSAVRVNAVFGVVAAAVLAAVSVGEGIFCFGCVVTYVLVLAYAAVAWRGLAGAGFPALSRGIAWAAGATLALYLAVLYPGLATPKNVAEAGRQAIAEATRVSPQGPEGAGAAAGASDPAAGGSFVDQQLIEFVGSLPPQLQQLLADELHRYAGAPEVPAPPPRALIGEAQAPVRITDFTDPLCPACAELHASFETFLEVMPPGSFSLEPRHFPLDAGCNPMVTHDREGDLRCLAAKVQICLEGVAGAFDFTSEMFRRQAELDEGLLFRLAESYRPRAELEPCIASTETAAKLEEDARYAARHQIGGTPLVLVNGRRASSLGPFLYSVILTGGATDHPAFELLPPPSAQARAGG